MDADDTERRLIDTDISVTTEFLMSGLATDVAARTLDPARE
jgi:hypothetical protein